MNDYTDDELAVDAAIDKYLAWCDQLTDEELEQHLGVTIRYPDGRRWSGKEWL